MSIIPDRQKLCEDIGDTALTCTRCGSCCREIEPGSNLVMVSPVEVRAIMAKTGFTFDEVAEPYPDIIKEGEKEYTLAWALVRVEGGCRFFKDGCCSIYEVRPWICRTYPFMLESGRIAVSPCNGVRSERAQSAELHQLVTDLLNRQKAELEEEERIAKVLRRVKIPAGQFVVIDGEGMRTIHG